MNEMEKYPLLMALPPDERHKIFAAINSLLVENNNLSNQLERLAEIKQNSQKQFEAGLKILKLK